MITLATNHGWSSWLRHGWAWPIAVWGVEDGGSDFQARGRRYRRRVKVGPVCFPWGHYWSAR